MAQRLPFSAISLTDSERCWVQTATSESQIYDIEKT